MCSEYWDSLGMYALCSSIMAEILWETVGHRRLQR